MQKERLALNHALMIEMVRSNGVQDSEFLQMLENGNSAGFERFGEGIPDWQTLIDFYNGDPDKLRNAIQTGYRITFLTKGALKSLLGIKFGLERDVAFRDGGYYLDQVKLSGNQLKELKEIISANWEIIEENQNDSMYELRIALINPPGE
ncbi:hypothetical protein DRW41_15845 [Neobacillus piezotolerans]|uniref:Uncharacterized protein n=1 Tax=Neobacillus piezotolerans TaxID=2259171 RepID=A0A3D8GPG3_9BACI|nr:hypothetical protein [Neobacillus piezotolerans]RDU36059.1 hypothetical protein DRW41_15845 [Neobacillus piezotolerans]